MRVTQGTFSYLPDLSDDEIAAQVRYCLENGWPVAVEHTDDPHPRHVYWDMFGLPMFDLLDPDAVMDAVHACREEFPGHYVRVSGYDRSYGRQTTAISFIVQRPADEPGFRVVRAEGPGRVVNYTLQPYAADRPAGRRYAAPAPASTPKTRRYLVDAEPAD
jgi:ribulose-bisphosphate carboxylase small chain